ncbi:MAG: TlpA disulfide reductase family protein [Proteobacteria bacterium]|nr:TlpA disulfide reductase family protein [Pseudomonadota bacterium]
MNSFKGRRLAIKGLAAAGAGLGGFGRAIASGIETGKRAPALDIKLLNGKILTATQLQGKVVVQMYWATWCPYCRADLAEMQRIYQQQQARGLEVVALSIDESDKTAREFWKGKNYSFPSAMRSDAIFEHYGRIGTTPTYFIIDREGVVRQRINGSPEPGTIAQLVASLL